jgi:pimeloyl-ACP methyl ester carboxylesterase
LHGALGSKDQFNILAEHFSGHFTIHTLNFEGHGSDISTNDFSMDRFVKNVLEYIEINKINGCNIFGYSMGGYVALKLAKDFSDKIGKIITLGTKLKWNPSIAENEIKMLDPVKIEKKVPAFAEVLRKRHHPADWKIVLNKTAAMIHGLGNGNALKPEEFKLINNPVVIALGSDDKMVSVEESLEVVEQLPEGKFVLLEGLGHLFEEEEEKFAGLLIDEFLAGIKNPRL